MPVGKRKSARIDLRLDEKQVGRLKKWLIDNPSVKSRTDAIEQGLEMLMKSGRGRVIVLTDEQVSIVNNYRRSIEDLPSTEEVIDELIKSLKDK